MKNNIIAYIKVTKALFDQLYLKAQTWWDSRTDDQQGITYGFATVTAVILGAILFVMTIDWFMDRSLYIRDKYAYEEYLDKAPEMPKFKERYRIVRYSDNDFMIEHFSNEKWTSSPIVDKYWSLSSARNRMWDRVADKAKDWIHTNAPETAEVIE